MPVKEDLINQKILEQIKNQPRPNFAVPQGAFGSCSQCGLIHPPLPPGQKCPNAPLEVLDENGNKLKVNVDKYFTSLKNILFSQVESKKIKNIDELFKKLMINTMKFLEEYKE